MPARAIAAGRRAIVMTGPAPRKVIRVALPSKGDMFKETRALLAEVGIDVLIHNPRQYVASLRGLDVELWLQRPADVVRKVRDGDVDLGFVGYDLVAEHGGNSGRVVPIHDWLGYGGCRLGVGVPMAWSGVDCMDEFKTRASVSGLRIATKYKNETERFMEEHGIGSEEYRIVNMDGALEASTQMGTADCIIDLISSGVTLRENLLKEISGGTLLNSSMQLVGNREHLMDDGEFGSRLRALTRELLERIEAHILGRDNYNIIANIRGSSMVDVSRKLASQTDLRGVDGPTVSPVVPPADSDEGMYAISIILPKEKLYSAVEQLRSVGGSGVSVIPVAFVFPKECVRWNRLLERIGLAPSAIAEVHAS